MSAVRRRDLREFTRRGHRVDDSERCRRGGRKEMDSAARSGIAGRDNAGGAHRPGRAIRAEDYGRGASANWNVLAGKLGAGLDGRAVMMQATEHEVRWSLSAK